MFDVYLVHCHLPVNTRWFVASSDSTYENNGYVYISYDYGNVWIQGGMLGAWSGISMSSSCQNQTAVQKSGYIYTSVWYPSPKPEITERTDLPLLMCDAQENKIYYNTGKTFVIDHPVDKNKYSVHDLKQVYIIEVVLQTINQLKYNCLHMLAYLQVILPYI